MRFAMWRWIGLAVTCVALAGCGAKELGGPVGVKSSSPSLQSPAPSTNDVAAGSSESVATSSVSTAVAELRDFPKLSADDWPWWRGPLRNGVATSGAGVPTAFSATENVVWKTNVPGRGHASPIVVGDRVFLATADEGAKVMSVVAFDRKTGVQLWKTDVSQGGFPRRIHGNNTHASPTVACDGERVFVTFFHHDSVQATALDLAGNQVWQKTVGAFRPRQYEYGYGPSPVLYKGTVIVAAECDGDSYIAALDRVTGDEKWKIPRPKNITYSTPAIANVGGREQMFLSGADKVASYDPATGKELWSTPGIAAATCGTAVWDGGLIFASGGYPKNETLAVKSDGSGAAWRNGQKCYEQSMLATAGHVYCLTDGGVAYCWQAGDGEEKWKKRLQGPVSASPVLAGGNIYQANERGTLYVFKAGPAGFELVAENKLGDESFASPAVSRGQLFLRVAHHAGKRQEALYCIGQK